MLKSISNPDHDQQNMFILSSNKAKNEQVINFIGDLDDNIKQLI